MYLCCGRVGVLVVLCVGMQQLIIIHYIVAQFL